MKYKNKTCKTIILLHVVLLIYSLFGMFSKLASQHPFLSGKFILYYSIVILNLGLYAICWQQFIKRLSLVTAFANKSITVIWGILWGFLFFNERITIFKIIGATIIVFGIILVVTDVEEADD